MKSVVLLSGGLDSTVALAAARQTSEVVLALTFDYGQRAVDREISAAVKIAQHYDIPHKIIKLDFLRDITTTSLVNHTEGVPTLTPDLLDDRAVTISTANQVWVPNRNGVFLNIAAAFCETLQCGQVIVGFNAEEGVTFPDNTPEYMAAATLAFSYSTQKGVTVMSPTVEMMKPQLLELGKTLEVPFQYIWSCYHGETIMCGECESCQRLKRALTSAGIADQLTFAR
jgi:7-cyano-7-deazaguanine synthase